MFALVYFIFVLWSIVCLIVALFKSDQDAASVFVIILPMVFIGFSCDINSSQFVADLYAWL